MIAVYFSWFFELAKGPKLEGHFDWTLSFEQLQNSISVKNNRYGLQPQWRLKDNPIHGPSLP